MQIADEWFVSKQPSSSSLQEVQTVSHLSRGYSADEIREPPDLFSGGIALAINHHDSCMAFVLREKFPLEPAVVTDIECVQHAAFPGCMLKLDCIILFRHSCTENGRHVYSTRAETIHYGTSHSILIDVQADRNEASFRLADIPAQVVQLPFFRQSSQFQSLPC